MRFPIAFEATLLLAGLAAAAAADEFAHIHHKDDTSPHDKRDEYCNKGSCVACFGPGMVVCSSGATVQTCFNPSAGEQCCADGSYCTGSGNCCGSVGFGITLSDSTPTPTPTGNSSPTGKQSTPSSGGTKTYDAPEASSSSWDCFASDSNEECCQRGGSANHWCYGNFPTRYCYRPSLDEYCCSDGNVCEGSGCCADFGAVATTPNAFQATSVPQDASPTSKLSLNTNFASSSGQTPTKNLNIPGVTVAGTTTSSSRPSATVAVVTGTGAAASMGVYGGAFAAAAGLLGLAFI